MNAFVPLTLVARKALESVLSNGSLAIDATVGNGHDTLFLANAVAPQGHVIGFDVQARALQRTRTRLSSAGLEAVATLILAGHENMSAQVPGDWRGEVSAVMFNLGYLPGGDKGLTTGPASTIAALDQAVSLLQTDGIISLLVYRGHHGAQTEAAAVQTWLEHLDASHQVSCHPSPGPVLYLIKRPS